MRTPPVHGGQFLNAHLGRASDFGLFWSFPTVELLLLKVDAVANVLGARGEKIFDTESIGRRCPSRLPIQLRASACTRLPQPLAHGTTSPAYGRPAV
jgi:hypothetical protein